MEPKKFSYNFSYNRLANINNKPVEQRTEEEKQYLAEYIADLERERQQREEEQKRLEANKAESEQICRKYWAELWRKQASKKTEITPEGKFIFTDYEAVRQSLNKNYDFIVRQYGGTMSSHSVSLCNVTAFYLTNNHELKQWLFLWGGVGVGKTTLSQALVEVFKNQAEKVLKVVNAANINAIKKDNPDEWQRIVNYPYLCIDDLGVEAVKVQQWGATEYPTNELIYNRYDKRLFTVFTSNLNFKNNEIANRYGIRVADRMTEMCRDIEFTQKSSYRQ